MGKWFPFVSFVGCFPFRFVFAAGYTPHNDTDQQLPIISKWYLINNIIISVRPTDFSAKTVSEPLAYTFERLYTFGMAKTSTYYVVLLNGRKYRVRGMRAVAELIGAEPHRVSRLLRSGRSAVYDSYANGVARFGPATTDDGAPYGSVLVARCREPGFGSRSYTSVDSAAKDVGVTPQCLYGHIARSTPVRDRFGYLWDIERLTPLAPGKFGRGVDAAGKDGEDV